MTRPRKILIIASPDLYASLAEQFARLGAFELVELDADALSASSTPDVLLAEAGFGESVIEGLRAAGFGGPILILGEGVADGVECVARPVRFADLVARIRARLRAETAREESLMVGAYRFRPGSNELTAGAGTRRRLTEKESAILARLATAGGAIVSKDVLLRDVWGYSPAVTTRTLETHVYRLRRKIEPDPSTPRILVTESDGYRLLLRRDAGRD